MYDNVIEPGRRSHLKHRAVDNIWFPGVTGLGSLDLPNSHQALEAHLDNRGNSNFRLITHGGVGGEGDDHFASVAVMEQACAQS